MGLISSELSLDLKPSYIPATINGFLKEVSMIGNVSERLEKVDEFVNKLEEEMKKIEVFKRELPLCLLLLKDAMMVLKQESTKYKTINAHQPILEEFIPLKKESRAKNTQMNEDDDVDSSKEKKNWMSTFKLWSTEQNQRQTLVSESQKGDDKKEKFVGVDLHDPCKIRVGSKGFVPMIHTNYPTFSELRREVDNNDASVPGLSLVIPRVTKNQKEETIFRGLNTKLGGSSISNSSNSTPASDNGQSNLLPGHQQSAARKQRRCWSPELHRRFVGALTQLGGPQVATPKQIRDLMRVDGLTNDEVKSHLQKYRLHTRRVSNNPTTSTNENDSNSSKPSGSQSGSPAGPLQFPGLTSGTSMTGCDSMDDDDDEKSESHSWKGVVQRPGKDDVWEM